MSVNTIRELLAHSRWGNDTLLAIALRLSDEQLDRHLEIGEGSLYATLRHLYLAERYWYERIAAPRWEALPRAWQLGSIRDVAYAACCLADLRAELASTLKAGHLEWGIAAMAVDGGPIRLLCLGDVLLHLCNHGIHHRAQALNMLRHLGAPTPKFGADYIFMYVENPNRPAPALEVDAIRRYFAYGDWAFDQVLDAAAGLSDDQLDRPFEMGLGTLRKTLVHVHDAERWWLRNWRNGPLEMFPTVDDSLPPVRLRELFGQTAQQRDAFIAVQTDPDLRQPTRALARQDDPRRFPLGVTMLQLCSHGTHHRAQALNMLRRLGAPVPELDWIDWTFA